MTETPQPQDGQQTPATTSPAEQKPPWGDDADFDPQKAWSLIEGLRADKERLSARKTLTAEQETQLAEYAQWKQQNQTEQQRQAEELNRWQTEADTWRKAAVGSRIEALASGEFADPSDAAAALSDHAKYLDAGGQIDEKAIKRDLADVLQKKPHWRRQEQPQGPRVPAPNPAQGTGSNGASAADPAQQFAAFIQGQLGS